jgi:hypothetical protein
MPELSALEFSHKEVVTALLKAQGINTGIWGLHVRFALKAANIGGSDADLLPAALVPILAIGIQKVDKLNNLAVDAAVVNPSPTGVKRIGSGKTLKARKKS